MHRGGPDTHKDAGEEVWIYDLASRQRVERVKLRSPGLTIYGFPIEFGQSWLWPFNRLSDWLLDTFVPAAVSPIQVTQDDAPLLFTASQFSGSLGVYDAHERRLPAARRPTGWTSDVLVAPWTGRGGAMNVLRRSRVCSSSLRASRWRCCSPVAAAHKLRDVGAFRAALAATSCCRRARRTVRRRGC